MATRGGQRRPILPGLLLLGLIALSSGCNTSDEAPTVALQSPLQAATANVALTPSATSAPPPTSSSPSTSTAVPATATRAPTSTATPSLTPSATPTATPSPTATETAVPPTPTVAEGSAAIIDLIYDPVEGRDADGEAVFIQNLSQSPIDMTGWTLTDIAGHLYTFPAFILQPGATVTIHICSGTDAADILFWNSCSAIWNNEGDTAYLHDAAGRLISQYSY